MAWDLTAPADNDKGKFFPALNRTDKTTLKNAWNTEHNDLAAADWKHKNNFLALAYIPDGLITLVKLNTEVKTTLMAPVGTRMLFDQDAPPTGWTRDVSLGSDLSVFIQSGARVHGGNWQITGLTQAAHSHTVNSHTHTVQNHVHGLGGHTHACNVDLLADDLFTGNNVANNHVALTNSGHPYTWGLSSYRSLAGTSGGPSGGSSNDGTHATSGTAPGTDSPAPAISSDGTWRPVHRDVIVAVKN